MCVLQTFGIIIALIAAAVFTVQHLKADKKRLPYKKETRSIDQSFSSSVKKELETMQEQMFV